MSTVRKIGVTTKEVEPMKKLRIFTDGACSGNPGAGGWAAVFALEEGTQVLSGGELITTNNRMELTAVMEALEYVAWGDNIDSVEIYSDSSYVINAIIKGWLDKWVTNNWMTVNKAPVKNDDLWQRVHDVLCYLDTTGAKIRFQWVKGHNGNPMNELADKEAVKAAKKYKIV